MASEQAPDADKGLQREECASGETFPERDYQEDCGDKCCQKKST